MGSGLVFCIPRYVPRSHLRFYAAHARPGTLHTHERPPWKIRSAITLRDPRARRRSCVIAVGARGRGSHWPYRRRAPEKAKALSLPRTRARIDPGTMSPPSGGAIAFAMHSIVPAWVIPALFYLYLGASFAQLLGEAIGVVFGDLFLDRLGGIVHQGFGFFEA